MSKKDKKIIKQINQMLWEIQLMEEIILGNKLPKKLLKTFKKTIKEMNEILEK